MNIVRCISEWQARRGRLSGRVGFVPTMGALHEGHLSLIRASVDNNEVTVLSIYVNATQFNDPADLAKYPSTLEADLAAAKGAGVDWVLLPDYSQIYADGYRYQLNEDSFSRQLCGTDRP
ncbi:MAG: pantoate--beta-alanine ligase, partial [Pseudomonadota bacterium]|nr:pantoate--beta-alanine ligase [Pseudomonadota bacterium]